MTDKNVSAIMIVEIAGRPAEYIKENLKLHIGQLKNAKDVEIISESISEPRRLESEQEMYTCFAEVEIRTLNLLKLIEIVFDYMPSSIEILEPSEFSLKISEANAFLNDLSGRLHRYDEIAKIAQIRVEQLLARFQAMQREIQERTEQNQKNQATKEKNKIKSKKKKTKSKKQVKK